MAVEKVAASLSSGSQPTESGQGSAQERISELKRLAQDVRKLKTEYQSKTEKSGVPQPAADGRIREYDKLIANIKREVRRLQLGETKKKADRKKGVPPPVQTFPKVRFQADHSSISVSALKAAYHLLARSGNAAALSLDKKDGAGESGAKEDGAESDAAGTTLDELI